LSWGTIRMAKDDQGVAAYVRISEGGPDRQEQELKISEKARSLGLSVDSHFIETAAVAAGDVVDRRVTLFEILAAARAGRINTVIAATHAAIAGKPIEAAIIAVMLERSGCSLVFAEPFDAGPYRQEAVDFIEGRAATPAGGGSR
jgi:hypothetical protein